MRIAVIDLGTNTFNLIIADLFQNEIKILSNTKESVKLGKGGIHKNLILKDAMERAMTALDKHFFKIKSFQVEEVIAIGTSALRTAANADEFKKLVLQRFGIDIQIISGEREAELIFLGVEKSLERRNEPYLILDIGGGSNEFILAVKDQILWKQSFPLGMARLNELFKPSDPIKQNEIKALESYFEDSLQPLLSVLKNTKIKALVGAEGAFETFYNCILSQQPQYIGEKAKYLEVAKFIEFHDYLIRTTAAERLQIKGMEPFRVEMVVPATVFVNFIVKKIGIEQIVVSGSSLKEGVLYERLKALNLK